ncbi:uncharacterized protein LOC108154487 [Drosophila miranda]|uniref:uncharacterized protein LOC108154487 n=1 Tax=Drosophila miranda TaxID=7229 RepID=UPI0007E811BE|nr:uncharacterized protein LOC108154487 [Drosophila miranda]
MLKKMSPNLGAPSEAEMDESGYMFSRVRNNSNEEAPVLLERDSKTENCPNNNATTLPKGLASSLNSHPRDQLWTKKYPLTIEEAEEAHNSLQLMGADAGRVLKEQQRIKCPRCGKSSRVFVSEAARERSDESLLLSQIPPPIKYAFSNSTRPPMSRFLPLDLEDIKGSQPTYTFAECTSVICKYRFCINCLCKSHPGERCLVTELGSPSTLLMPRERLTPPQRNQRQDPKLKKKNSLKRLCF